jgi:DNA-binding NarL/FixJ family response regulator
MQMESALTEAGFEVAGLAASGEEAIELALTERPRLAVMDVPRGIATASTPRCNCSPSRASAASSPPPITTSTHAGAPPRRFRSAGCTSPIR